MNHECRTGGERKLLESAYDIAAQIGVESHYGQEAALWASRALHELHGAQLYSPKAITHAFGATSHDTLTMPCDSEGVPLFRVRYIAQTLVNNQLTTAGLIPPDDTLQIIPHYDKLALVTHALVAEQRANNYPFNRPDAEVPNRSDAMPSEELLPRGTREHALYLWHACYWMGGGIESNLAFRSLTELYTKHPELFDPTFVVENELNETQIEQLISPVSPLNFNLQRIKKYWVKNAHKLYDQYGSDPRQIFADNPGYRTIKQRLSNKKGRGFLGFQEKMDSMYAHFLSDAGIIPEIPFPPPVDFHVLRLAIACGVITCDNIPANGNIFSPKTIGMVRKMFYDHIVVTGESELEIDDAWWRYSKLMCANAPGNESFVDRSAARGSMVGYPEVDFTDPATMARFVRSCGQCAVADLCRLSITSGEYYAGDVIIPRPRKTPADTPGQLIEFHPNMIAPIQPGHRPQFIKPTHMAQLDALF